MPSAPPLIEAVGVERRFGALTALAGVSLDAGPGELVLLIGPNGAGKTTLLRCLAGLMRPSRGTIRIDGMGLSTDAALRGRIGLLSHQAHVYDDLTARENLRFAAELHDLRNVEQRVALALDQALLTERADTLVRGFSRGMLQRLAIARATLHDPAIILLDEPFTGLDAAAADALRVRLGAQREAGCAQLCVTHDPAELWELATRVVVLVGGRVVVDAERPALLDAFRDEYARMIAA